MKHQLKTHTQTQTSHKKAIIAFLLVLCLTMPIFLSAAAVSIIATHTHVCHDEEHKDVCTDVRKCCIICLNFYEAKYRFQYRHYDVVNRFSYPSSLSSEHFTAEPVSLSATSTTLISLKVRLNN